jgi:ribosomal protein S18 acetylase RimI-like enzyme
MAIIQTLEQVSIEAILQAFNLSFSDYVIPFFLTKEQLEDKIKGDGVRLEFSVGAFEGNQLIAFVLHGYDIVDNVRVAYNAGTGVVPAQRGNKLIAQLYEYALPIFRSNNISKVILEVITINERAIRTYRSIGFQIARHLNCFKGSINLPDTTNDFEVHELKAYDWGKLRSFWDLNPTWQNSSAAVEKLRESTLSIGAYENENLLGYAIYNPVLKRVHQFAVDKNYRNRGVGTHLFNFISTSQERTISVINIDDTSTATLNFMAHIGMNKYIEQYEMVLNL